MPRPPRLPAERIDQIPTNPSAFKARVVGVAMIMLRKYTTSYWSHVAIGCTFGMSYTAYPRFADIIWSAFPPGYQLMMIFSDGFSWILITMVMAWFIVPPSKYKSAAA